LHFFVHVKHVSNVTFIIYPTDICQIMKISTKINNTMQNINILLFVHSLSLTRLKLCS